MKGATPYSTKLLRISCLFSFFFLLFLILSIILINNNTQPTTNVLQQQPDQIQYVYIPDNDQSQTTEVYYEDNEPIFIVCEYMGKIGIFSKDGALIHVIEVYVKTLPIADRRLLEEGFEVVGKQRLYSIIEDYSV